MFLEGVGLKSLVDKIQNRSSQDVRNAVHSTTHIPQTLSCQRHLIILRFYAVADSLNNQIIGRRLSKQSQS